MKKPKGDYAIQTVVNAMRLLEAFRDEEELGVTELSRRLSLHKNNVFRLLATLEQQGYIEQSAASDRYRLGVESLELGQAFLRGRTLLRRARADSRGARDEARGVGAPRDAARLRRGPPRRRAVGAARADGPARGASPSAALHRARQGSARRLVRERSRGLRSRDDGSRRPRRAHAEHHRRSRQVLRARAHGGGRRLRARSRRVRDGAVLRRRSGARRERPHDRRPLGLGPRLPSRRGAPAAQRSAGRDRRPPRRSRASWATRAPDRLLPLPRGR